MGTRADFYIGIDRNAEWLGSIAWDGYPDGIPDEILTAATEADFRNGVRLLLLGRDDATTPEHGWPWPWESSRLTDFSYAWQDGTAWIASDGWYAAEDWAADPKPDPIPEDFPDMSSRQAVTMGKRSGLIVLGG